MSFHRIRFRTKSPYTDIWLDGKKLNGVVGADFHFAVNEIPRVNLTIVTPDITIDGDTVDVYIQKEKEDPHGTAED